MSAKASHSKMSKHKPVKVKLEKADTIPNEKCSDENDLTFYVKDRVELMRKIFSILKDRELIAMAPDCLRGLKADSLQEALLDEVLGISSKRLLSIIDGYECPSNTDSSEDSSNEAFETISLDSISSDEDGILSHQDHKSKKKHTKKKIKEKLEKEAKKKIKHNENPNNVKNNKRKKEQSINDTQNADGTGMTVLELLELQARARAIRAQLAAVEIKDSNEENKDDDSDSDSSGSDEDEVVIKEEPPEIVEIQSSSDENETKKDSNKKSKKHNGNQTGNNINNDSNDFVKPSTSVNVEHNSEIQQPRKVKLNRSNVLQVTNINSSEIVNSGNAGDKDHNKNITSAGNVNNQNGPTNNRLNEDLMFLNKIKENDKKASLVRDKKESDEDEITLELSDSEKMDLLEGFHSPNSYIISKSRDVNNSDIIKENNGEKSIENKNDVSDEESSKSSGGKRKKLKKDKRKYKKIKYQSKNEENLEDAKKTAPEQILNKVVVTSDVEVENASQSQVDKSDENKSEGECSSEANSEHEVLCISDEDMSEIYQNNKMRQYRKRKKDKITDEEVVENDSSNLTENNTSQELAIEVKDNTEEVSEQNVIEDVVEKEQAEQENIPMNPSHSEKVFEISDESEDDVSNVLSKEPTIQEIKEFSQKIDIEIDRENLNILEDSSIDLKIRDNELEESNQPSADTSWKTRWLKSNKVQRVLATSNLCNALRKKNKELKKKLESNVKNTDEQEKIVECDSVMDSETTPNVEVIEGSVSEYEKLTGSTKYVAPVEEPKVDEKAMVNDAKQLLKMYKKLLKIHDLDGGEEKKKAKKLKKDKKKEKREKKKNKMEKSNVSDSTNSTNVQENQTADNKSE